MSKRKDRGRESDVPGVDEVKVVGVEKIFTGLEGGEEEALTSRQRSGFRACEVYESANYIRNLSRRVLKG